jgi:hypothetical protein
MGGKNSKLVCNRQPLNAEVENRIRAASVAELDAVGERLLFATTLQQALGE